MKTFQALKDDTLRFFDLANEADDTADVLLVEGAINRANASRITEDRWKFMLSPTATLTLVAGQNRYILPHYNLDKLQYLYSTVNKRFFVSLPTKQVPYADINFQESGDPLYFSIYSSASPVKMQPTTAGVLTVTSTASETGSPKLLVQGEDSNGDPVEEELSVGVAGSVTFATITYIAKAADFSGTITLSCGSDTLLTLLTSEYAKQYPVIEFHSTPMASEACLYRYFKKPRVMTRAFDIPDLPYPHSDILVYDALLDLATYNELDSESVNIWREKQLQLKTNLYLNLLEPDVVAGIGVYTNPGSQ